MAKSPLLKSYSVPVAIAECGCRKTGKPANCFHINKMIKIIAFTLTLFVIPLYLMNLNATEMLTILDLSLSPIYFSVMLGIGLIYDKQMLYH